jgi:putative membrane-bound dehydrogenase-like protein
MTRRLVLALVVMTLVTASASAGKPGTALPAPSEGWSIELVAQAPQVVFPTAIVAAPDGTIYLGSDPMDMSGPATEPIDRVVAVKNGQVTVFADKLWSVMGLEWIDGIVYVVHAPFLSAFRDTDGDGKADSREDLVTGLGPKVPGFNGINDHIASGIRLGMDGFLYIAVGDKGIPRGLGRDGKTIQLRGGGVIRVRPDGTGLEVVSTGECNPLSVALSATDDVFTYGNDDDSKKWPNSLTHHIVGGHHGYPYQFQASPHRALPIMFGEVGGVGTQGICYNEDGLPDAYRGNLFFCDWGRQAVFRFEIKKAGGTFALTRRTVFVSKGDVSDFRPFSVTVAADARSLWLVDWAYNGWLAKDQRAGRLYRLRYTGPNPAVPIPRPSGDEPLVRLKSLDHPALAVRLESQRMLERKAGAVIPLLVERLNKREPETGRLHALWALDAIGGSDARRAIGSTLADRSAKVRLQAARSVGIHRDREFLPQLLALLSDRDAAVRREAAIAAGRLGDLRAAPALYAALGDSDTFAAWSIRQAIRCLNAWDKPALVEALLDERRLESALRLTDEAWAVPVVDALTEALGRTRSVPVKARIVANLAGLYRRYPEWSGQWFGTNPLAGQAPRKTVDWSAEGMKGVERGLSLALADRDRAVRFQAIVGLTEVGPTAAHWLRAALVKEPDPVNQAVLAEALGALLDPLAGPILAVILKDAGRPEAVREAALAALSRNPDPQSLRARFTLLYDPNAPASLIARALPDLARLGFLPPNDLVSFLEHAAPSVRAAAVLSLNVKKALPADLQQSVLDRLSDKDAAVREAAMMAVVPLRLRAAVPRLLAIADDSRSPDRAAAMVALCGIPDLRAVSFYLAAIEDRDPRLRRAGELALLAIRDGAREQLASALSGGTLGESAMLTLERVLGQFKPIGDWRVIGPFPRASATEFVGEPTINFALAHAGLLGRPVSWAKRQADPATGRVDLSDFKQGAGDSGGAGYDDGVSPDLGAFAYTEVDADRAGPALFLIGSSGTLIVTVNEKPVYHYNNAAGRGYAPGTDVVRLELAKGRNRILVACRQGIGPWCFGLQIALVARRARERAVASASLADLRIFALVHEGDPKKGEAIFFDAKGVGCVRCHTAAGRGNSTIGPDLAGLAAKYDRAEVIRSVLEPSHRITTGYQPVIISTRDGKVATGVVRSESDTTLELADSEAKITKIPKSDIAVRRVGDVSIMPAKLVETLSPAEFADLVSFLVSLKQPQAPAVSRDRTQRR